jgi:hypothetical protein
MVLHVADTTESSHFFHQPKLTNNSFVGTTFIMMLTEFPHLLSPSTTTALQSSLHLTSHGDSYRVGGVDDDNLYPSYSNPALMRAFVSVWVGLSQNDTNMTLAGEHDAQQIIDLFERANTLSEFNSGTYTGVSLFALTLWVKYLPEEHFMHQKGRVMIEETWKAIGGLWHPDLKNMAGPWDRAYGFDMRRYLSLLALWFWTVIGKEAAGLVRYVRFVQTPPLSTPYLITSNRTTATNPLALRRLRLGPPHQHPLPFPQHTHPPIRPSSTNHLTHFFLLSYLPVFQLLRLLPAMGSISSQHHRLARAAHRHRRRELRADTRGRRGGESGTVRTCERAVGCGGQREGGFHLGTYTYLPIQSTARSRGCKEGAVTRMGILIVLRAVLSYFRGVAGCRGAVFPDAGVPAAECERHGADGIHVACVDVPESADRDVVAGSSWGGCKCEHEFCGGWRRGRW